MLSHSASAGPWQGLLCCGRWSLFSGIRSTALPPGQTSLLSPLLSYLPFLSALLPPWSAQVLGFEFSSTYHTAYHTDHTVVSIGALALSASFSALAGEQHSLRGLQPPSGLVRAEQDTRYVIVFTLCAVSPWCGKARCKWSSTAKPA